VKLFRTFGDQIAIFNIEAHIDCLSSTDSSKDLEKKLSSPAVSKDGAPALAYHWDFSDGVVADGAILTHTYRVAGNYRVRFAAEGLDGKSADKTFSIAVTGSPILPPPRRYTEPHE